MIKQDYYATNKQGNCVNYGFKCFSCSHWHGYFDNGTCDMFKTTFTTTSGSMIKKDLEEVTANGLSVMEEMGIKITPKKRFDIVKSKLVKNAYVIEDKEKQFTFPTLVGDNRGLIAYEKALNKLSEENEELKNDLNDALNRIEERSIDIQLLKEENELKGDFRNFINEDIIRIKNENKELKKEVKNLNVLINNSKKD